MAKPLSETSKSQLVKQNTALKKKVKGIQESAQQTGEAVLCGAIEIVASGATAYGEVRYAPPDEMQKKIMGMPVGIPAAGAQIIAGALIGGTVGNCMIASGKGSACGTAAVMGVARAMQDKAAA